jgi:ABC-type Zn uptake system ZnuABC Zn-binding protein ZnuA
MSADAGPFVDEFVIANMLIALNPQFADDLRATLAAALDGLGSLDDRQRRRMQQLHRELTDGLER